jgi:hypothetical protein
MEIGDAGPFHEVDFSATTTSTAALEFFNTIGRIQAQTSTPSRPAHRLCGRLIALACHTRRSPQPVAVFAVLPELRFPQQPADLDLDPDNSLKQAIDELGRRVAHLPGLGLL